MRISSLQTSSDGNQTTSTLSIVLSHSDANKYLSCRAYNHAVPTKVLEDRWRLDIQCKYYSSIMDDLRGTELVESWSSESSHRIVEKSSRRNLCASSIISCWKIGPVAISHELQSRSWAIANPSQLFRDHFFLLPFFIFFFLPLITEF